MPSTNNNTNDGSPRVIELLAQRDNRHSILFQLKKKAGKTLNVNRARRASRKFFRGNIVFVERARSSQIIRHDKNEQISDDNHSLEFLDGFENERCRVFWRIKRKKDYTPCELYCNKMFAENEGNFKFVICVGESMWLNRQCGLSIEI